jgi:HK97 family phage major capsid protein
MFKLNDGLEKRGELIEKCRSLVDLTEKESRNLTSSENKDYECMLSEIETLSKDIEETERAFAAIGITKMTDEVYNRCKPGIGSSSLNKKIQFYDKDSLKELRSFIGSQGKLGISDQNQEELSAGKYLRGVITGDWKNAAAEKRTLGTMTNGGGNLIPEEISSKIITMALAKCQLINAGAQIFPMLTKIVTIPKITAMPQTEWKLESEKFSKSKDMTFSGLEMISCSLLAMIDLSLELLQDGVGMPEAIEQALSTSLAQELDRVGLNGSGAAGTPRGIANTADVLTESYSTITDYGPFSRAYAKIEAANSGPANSMIASSGIYGELDLLTAGTDGQPLLSPPSWSKYSQFSSNQISNMAILGDFTQCLIGTRQTILLEISRVADESFDRANITCRAFLRADIGVKNPKSFCVISKASS